MTRVHDRTHFYKYMSADAAVPTLANATLKWSSPSIFNDPFDHQTNFIFDFTAEQFEQAIYAAQMRLIFGREDPIFEVERQIGINSLLFRNNIDKFNPGKLAEQIRARAKHAASRILMHHDQFNTVARSLFLTSRVLCLTEEYANLLMWSHYADQHRGVVLRLECVDALDDNLIAARKINYVRDFPKFVPLDQWVLHLTGEREIDFPPLIFEMSYVKSSEWSYENEWRVFIPGPFEDPNGTGFTLIGKDRSVFTQVFLGCRITDDDKRRVIEAAEMNPNAAIYQMHMSSTSFALEVERIS